MDELKQSIKSNLRTSKPNTFTSSNLGKVPPQATDLEEVVLGAIMLEKDALSAIVDAIKPESFYKDSHRFIYEAILDLFSKSQPIDILTVTQKLREQGTLTQAGGPAYVTSLTASVTSAANIEYHARIIAEMAMKRDLIKVSGELQKEAFEDGTDVFELLDKAEQNLFKVMQNNISKNYADINSVVRDALEAIEKRRGHEDVLTGVPSGMTDLDRLTNGWQKSDLIIIAARPAMGKTAFALSMCRNAAVRFKKGVAIFSLEMSDRQLVERMLSAEAEIPGDYIRKGNLSEQQWQHLYSKADNLSKAPIFIDDSSALSVLELRAKCRRLKAQHDIQLVVIDYLQLMKGEANNKTGNREQEIAYISRSLKGLAKELDIPVIALAQLNREADKRPDKKPIISDLRESGSIEQDADQVFALFRPSAYGITEDESGNSVEGIGYVLTLKNRHGALEEVALRFRNEFAKFEDLGADSFGAFNPATSMNSALNSGGIPNDFMDTDGDTGSSFFKSSRLGGGGANPLKPSDDVPF